VPYVGLDYQIVDEIYGAVPLFRNSPQTRSGLLARYEARKDGFRIGKRSDELIRGGTVPTYGF
jgi:hypothetical protein